MCGGHRNTKESKTRKACCERFGRSDEPGVVMSVGHMTLKTDRATRTFLRFDRRDWAILNSTGILKKNSDRAHCHFVELTGDIGLF